VWLLAEAIEIRERAAEKVSVAVASVAWFVFPKLMQKTHGCKAAHGELDSERP
jgi:hypothetical protein